MKFYSNELTFYYFCHVDTVTLAAIQNDMKMKRMNELFFFLGSIVLNKIKLLTETKPSYRSQIYRN